MENKKREITLGYLFGVFKKSVIVMIIAAIVAGALGAVYVAFIKKPSYQATATFLVNNTASGDEFTSQNLTSAAIAIATNCSELVNYSEAIRRVVEDNGLAEKLGCASNEECVNMLRGMMSGYKTQDDAALFSVTVTSGSAETTKLVLDAVRISIPQYIEEVYSFNHKIEGSDGELKQKSLVLPVGFDDVYVIKSSPITAAILLALIAAVIVYLVYFTLTVFDNSIYGELTVRDNFDHPVIGSIPSWYLSEEELNSAKKTKKTGAVVRNYKNRLLTTTTPFFITEAFNTLRTNIIFAAAAAKNPIFVLTSDVPGVGKTVTSANIAIALANLDKRVLLVECDMRCPAFNRLFNKKTENGLSDLLAGIANETSEVAVNYEGTSLDIVFCGKIPPNPSELLSGYRMKELAEEWKKQYDYILLDMPPIGEVTDAGVVADIATGYVLTVRCNCSNVKYVRTAVERINAVNGNIMGIVLNGVDPKSSGKKKYSMYYKHYYTRIDAENN